jgi:two-component system chemotaxis response regulator CheB
MTVDPKSGRERDHQDSLRVLVVDDSAYNRQTITSMLETMPGVRVVGRATNGKEALRLVFDLEPDVITLDLEMPEMDGFAFLRLLMHKRPTPVLVVSGYAQRENVFRALELGALDFVAKPSRDVTPDLRSIEHELASKIALVRRLQIVRVRERARALARLPGAPAVPIELEPVAPRCVVAIAASTGGPPAVQQLLGALPATLNAALLVAQHMPARFTRAFAERLDRLVPMRVVEAEDAQLLAAGTAYIAPGAAHFEVTDSPLGPMARILQPTSVAVGAVLPSADRLFRTVATLYGSRMCAVVLTGMGTDGKEGSRAAKGAGAHVIAEDPRTAVMPGMPQSAIATGLVDEVMPLEGIAASIIRFVDSLNG